MPLRSNGIFVWVLVVTARCLKRDGTFGCLRLAVLVAIDLLEELGAKVGLDQVGDEVVVELLLVVLDIVHQASHLLLSSALSRRVFESHGDIFLGRFRSVLGFQLALLVVSVDLQEVLSDEPSELCLQGLWQVHADVPNCRAAVVL